MLMLSTIAKCLQIEFSGQDMPCRQISTDTRTLQPGDVFLALRGESFDGHHFISQAEEKGAIACIVERKVLTGLPLLVVQDSLKALGQIAYHHRKHFNLPIIAITGSCGKTSVKEMLKSILERCGSVVVNPGNFNNEIGVPLTLLTLKDSHDYAIVEMGACRLGDIQYLMSLTEPSISLITNAGLAHVGVFGSEETIAQAKGEIYQYLPQEGIAVLDKDQKYCELWKKFIDTKHCITFSSQKPAELTARILSIDSEKTTFELSTQKDKITITLQTPGVHQVQNALGAASIAYALSIPLKEIQQGLMNFKGVKGRLERKIGLNGVKIIDDTYNANPVSVQRALEVLAKTEGKKWFVFGDMLELGPQTEEWHFQVGQIAKDLGIDHVLTVGQWTVETISGFDGGRHFSTKDALIQTLRSELDSNSVLLVKGSRGMHMEEIVNALLDTQEVTTC